MSSNELIQLLEQPTNNFHIKFLVGDLELVFRGLFLRENVCHYFFSVYIYTIAFGTSAYIRPTTTMGGQGGQH